MARANTQISLTQEDRLQLESMARSKSLPHAEQRAQIVLMSADGLGGTEVARRTRTTRPTVSLWRSRFRSRGIAGLHNVLKPGRPRSTTEEQVAELINTALQKRPPGKTHWSRRGLADKTGLSTTTVHRYLTLFGVQPHRSSFKLSTDPLFIEKVRDVVGLYLNPPEQALVLCVDEKSRFRPWIVPAGTADGAGHASSGAPTTTCARHHHAVRRARCGRRSSARCTARIAIGIPLVPAPIDTNVPAELDVHLICDNSPPTNTPSIARGCAAHPRFHLHFTPTNSSWLNQVERWFGLTHPAGHSSRVVPSPVTDLKRRSARFLEHYNQHPGRSCGPRPPSRSLPN